MGRVVDLLTMNHDGILSIPVSSLVIRSINPNVMEPEQYALLVKSIQKMGFLQPILVRPLDDGSFEVIDGAHRTRAAKEIGLAEVLAVVRSTEEDDAALLQIGMNRLRGSVDIGKAADVITELTKDGYSLEELTVTGFTTEELDEMVRQASLTTEDVLGSGAADVPPEDSDSTPLVTMELEFSSSEDMKRAKRALRKAAGKGNPLSEGLLKMIDGE